LCRNDGPLRDVLFNTARGLKADVTKVMLLKAKELINPEWGCLAVIVDPIDIGTVTNMLKPGLHLYHSMVYGSITAPKTEDGDRDMRLSPFYEVSCMNLVTNIQIVIFNLCLLEHVRAK
jgi:hypothetical protein